MFRFDSAAARRLRASLCLAMIAGAALLAGCATHYVDGATREVPPAQFVKAAGNRPVQLLTEFQTRGVANAQATAATKEMIADNVRSTGLFTQVSDAPVPDAGVLSVTVNNVPLADDAAAKGFIAGLTLGVAGQQVTDGYICTVSYLAPGQSRPIVKSAKHAIHTTVGASAAPPNTYKASGLEDAVRLMVRQVMSVALNDLSHDPEFR